MFLLVIVIPCYNEALRFQKEVFASYCLQHNNYLFVFVNDGSTDATGSILSDLKSMSPSNVIVCHQQNNGGKGSAVFAGIKYALQHYSHEYIAFLDSDLSISFQELLRIHTFIINEGADFAIGSKIRKMDTHIERSLFRHLMSRMIATVLEARFALGCYDTQCGVKVFRSRVIEQAMQQPFYTRWFFDVEILLRLRRTDPTYKGLEIPLLHCSTIKNSKINILSSPLIIKELGILFFNY